MVILSRFEVPLPRYWRNRSFAGFKTGLTAFAVQFLEIWRLFCWIGWSVAKISAKKFIFSLRNRFYVICCFVFTTLEVVLGRSEVHLPRYGRKYLYTGFETRIKAFAVLFLKFWILFWVERGTFAQIQAKTFIRRLRNCFHGIRSSIFRNLVVILSWSEVSLPRYRRKRLFDGFVSGFMSFDVLFLEHLWIFWVIRKFLCQDTCENVHSPALKLVLRHSLLYI